MKINIIGIMLLVLIAFCISPIVNSTTCENAQLDNKNLNIVQSNEIIPEPGEQRFYFIVKDMHVTFNGSVDHSGLSWSGFGVHLTWITNDTVNISGEELFRKNFSFVAPDGVTLICWFFIGYNGISPGFNQPPGYIEGFTLMIRLRFH